MAIADTIQSMYDNVGDVYDTITNVDLPTNKNIQNIPSTMRSSYLEIMNNGIDKIWNNWEKVEGTGETLTLNSTEEAPMKINLKGNTSQEGTPTPTTPQDIQVVSGDNEINVCGKNLFDINSCPILEYAFYDGNGNPVSWAGTCGIREYIKLEENLTYTIKYNSSSNFLICFYDKNKTYLSQLTKASGGNFTMPSTAKYIRFGINTAIANVEWCQIEKGTTATTYETYQGQTYPINIGNIELCKIGNYQDSIKKSTGKNLWNGTFELSGIDTTTGQDGASTDRVRTKGYVEVKSNTTYTLSGVQGSRVVCFYNSSKAYLSYEVVGSQSTSGTFTTPNDTSYIRWYIIQTNTNINEMLNEGSTALPYEPYGSGDWYLHKETGKITFNGSENWGRSGNTSESFFCGALAGSGIPFKAKMSTAIDSKCDYFTKGNRGSNAEVFDMYNGTDYYTAFALYLSTSRVNDITAFKSWLASNNITLYYVLYQPTYTEITDTTLQQQLNALEKARSYNSQTSISQENNDKPFILDATALKQLTQ